MTFLQELAVKLVQPEPLLSLSFLRERISAEFQGQFVEDTGTCLDCGSGTVLKDGELVCSRCGRVWSEKVDIEDEAIPFESSSTEVGHSESHYNPPSQLAFGKGMGGFIDGRQLFRIVATAPSGNKDLPLRACQVKLLTSKLDHPTVQTILSYGSALCYQFGFKSNKDSDQVFSNQLGRLLRKVAAYYILRNNNEGELRRVVNAVFYMQFVGVHPNEAQRVFDELYLNVDLLRYVQNFLSFLTCPKQPKKRKIALSKPDC